MESQQGGAFHLRNELVVAKIHKTSFVPFLIPLGVEALVEGTLYITQAQTYFCVAETGGLLVSLPHGLLERVRKVQGKEKTNLPYVIEVVCKDLRAIRFELPGKLQYKQMVSVLESLAYEMEIPKLFAFRWGETANVPRWRYDAEQEYVRCGLHRGEHRLTNINRNYAVCDSYPQLLAVPAQATDEVLRGVAAFRSRGRMPVATYLLRDTGAALYRCSQPLVGLKNTKCVEDEQMLAIMAGLPLRQQGVRLHIMDARPKVAAVGNKFLGAGMEHVGPGSRYEGCSLEYLNIGNIHTMRGALQKLMEGLELNDSRKQEQAIDRSDWKDHLTRILAGAARISGVLGSGSPVLVHCLAEKDMQVLTNDGFKALSEIENHFYADTLLQKESSQLLFASFDDSARAIRYERADRLVVRRSEEELVEFSERESDVSVLVTGQHDMWVYPVEGHGGYGKVKAEDLQHAEVVRFQAHAAEGVHSSKSFCVGVKLIEDGPEKILALYEASQIEAFLNLYGYWLGNIGVEWEDKEEGASFFAFSTWQCQYLEHVLNDVGLIAGCDWSRYAVNDNINADFVQHGQQYCYCVTRACWVDFFDSMRTQQSGVPEWAFHCDAKDTEKILLGLVAANGNQTQQQMTVFTPSVLLRDQLVQLALHAGFSACFSRSRKKKNKNAYALGSDEGWSVSFTKAGALVEPLVYPAQTTRRHRNARGDRVWCVSVPSGLILVRRVVQEEHKGDLSFVASASRPVVVGNCTDGWDRTAQLTCLTQMMMDPYYRSLDGFAVLVEKEWISFGHKFAQRHGHGTFSPKWKDTQRAPIFMQFIDCCWQLTQQFPTSFEWNERHLMMVVDACYSTLFGTFLCNTDQERRVLYKVYEGTVSLWAYLEAHRDLYVNPLYEVGEKRLIPKLSGMQIWRSFYCRFQWASINELAGVPIQADSGLSCATFNSAPRAMRTSSSFNHVTTQAPATTAAVRPTSSVSAATIVQQRLTRGERSGSVTMDDIDGAVARRKRLSIEMGDNESLDLHDGPSSEYDVEEDHGEADEAEEDEQGDHVRTLSTTIVMESFAEPVMSDHSEVLEWNDLLEKKEEATLVQQPLVLSPRQNASKRRGVKLDASDLLQLKAGADTSKNE